MDDCIFCKIVRGEIPTTFVAENQHAVAFDDIAPVTPVHTLVVPRLHIASMSEATADDEQMLAACLLLARDVAVIKEIRETGWRVGTNTGPDAGQSVFHLHFHVMGGTRLSLGG